MQLWADQKHDIFGKIDYLPPSKREFRGGPLKRNHEAIFAFVIPLELGEGQGTGNGTKVQRRLVNDGAKHHKIGTVKPNNIPPKPHHFLPYSCILGGEGKAILHKRRLPLEINQEAVTFLQSQDVFPVDPQQSFCVCCRQGGGVVVN